MSKIILDQSQKIEMAKNIGMQMMIAAETAPKGKGRNTIQMCLLQHEEQIKLCSEMIRIAEDTGPKFFNRDAQNIQNSLAILVIGSEISPLNLPNCGFCGFEGCSEKELQMNAPCCFNSIDLGIAIGSAVSTALMHKVDTRVMYSAGKAAISLNLLGENVKIAFGIPISISSKNIFFDRT